MVTRGAELCSGYGTIPEATPRMTMGSTSMWVYLGSILLGTVKSSPHHLQWSTQSPSLPGFIQSASMGDMAWLQHGHLLGVS